MTHTINSGCCREHLEDTGRYSVNVWGGIKTCRCAHNSGNSRMGHAQPARLAVLHCQRSQKTWQRDGDVAEEERRSNFTTGAGFLVGTAAPETI
jgi:hypothetical protein